MHLSSLTACAQLVQHHGQDDDRALDDQLPVKRNVHQSQSIIQDGDDQSSNQRAKDGSNSTHETCTAQDHRRDGIQLVADAQLTLGAVKTAGAHDTPKSREKPAYAIGKNQDQWYGNTGQSSRLRITADRIDVHS